jgi:hypothetical protein
MLQKQFERYPLVYKRLFSEDQENGKAVYEMARQYGLDNRKNEDGTISFFAKTGQITGPDGSQIKDPVPLPEWVHKIKNEKIKTSVSGAIQANRITSPKVLEAMRQKQLLEKNLE